MKTIMESVMNQVVDARAEGDLILSSGKLLRLSSQDGKISTYTVSGSQILGIRVIKDGKVGLSYTESLDSSSLEDMVNSALENAAMGDDAEHETILDINGHLEDEAHYGERATDISVKTSKAIELETIIKREEKRAKAVPYNGYTESESSSYFLSSKGRSTSYYDKQYSISTSALLEESGRRGYFGYYNLAHRFDDLDWKSTIDTSLFHARNLLNETVLPTGKYNVCFNEDCLKALMECFSNFYSAKQAIYKMNPWAEEIGNEVVSPTLSIFDDPVHTGAFRATRFDGEGVEARTLQLVENGVLKSLLHNSVTARYYKTTNTGHAYRAPGGPLDVSGTHFVIKGNKVSPRPPKYLEIIQMDGLYSGAKRVTGDFSVGVKGYVWDGGQRKEAFGNITLSGNLMELMKQVEVTGSELLASTDRSFFSVPLMFYDLSIAGS